MQAVPEPGVPTTGPAEHADLERLLAAWMPAQRWFAGGAAHVPGVTITSDIALSGPDPELRHLIADVRLGPETVSYQVLVAFRANVPPELAGSVIGTLPDGRIACDGALDPGLATVLLRGIADERTAAQLRFAREPGAVVDRDAAARILPALASNTSIVFGDRAILKVLRRPSPGRHPDLEIPSALARAGSKLVPAPLGWIELTGAEPTVLAIMSEFYAGATDGWSLATASMQAGQPDFSAQARLLGQATARLHAELAAAFGTSTLSAAELGAMARALEADLAGAVAVVPELRQYQAGVLACYAELARPGSEVVVQRIHGDYHLAQVLSTGDGWVVLDFEGEPSVPLARRTAFAPAQRDVAGMLRSFDYAARHQALRHPADQRLASAAHAWVRRCQEAFLAGYAQAGGADPNLDQHLLRALTYAKAVYEAGYEARHRPDWLPIPLAALAEASQ
ncbi:MAG TPA: aminoglycoside phosphotransferase [Streptosporangiaceae bacterium]